MKFSVITVFPEMIERSLEFGVISQAQEQGLLEVKTCSPRIFSSDKHKTVDDRPFGGGDGMVMLAETLVAAIDSVRTSNSRVIYLSPQGGPLKQNKVKELAQGGQDLILVCGRYGGIDQRVLNQSIDEEISIGDYVLSGGELGALVLIDAVSRWIPGVLGHQDSAESDSFGNGLLEAPQFSRPREFNGETIPDVLTSGHHAKISEWRWLVSLLVTLQKRPDLFWEYVDAWKAPSKKSKPLLEQIQNFWESLSDQDKEVLGFDSWVFSLERKSL